MAKASSQKKPTKPAPKKPAPAAKKPSAPAKKAAAPVKKAVPQKAAAKPVAKAKPAPKKPAAKTALKTASKPAISLVKAPAAPVKKPTPKVEYKPAKLPEGYKPTEKEEYMNPLQQEFFRQKLLDWRGELIAESRETLDHLHEEDWHQADIADRASLETEAGVELRTRNRYLKLISKIDSAIRRIEQGEYGYCEETGEPIGLKRLQARPVATLSIEAQERHEKMERQYTDEE